MLEEFPNSSKNTNTFAAWNSCHQSTTNGTLDYHRDVDCFSTRKMWQGIARSSSSAVPQTTAQRSTSRRSQSAVPRTTARTSTLSAEQQRLREVAAYLPTLYSYGNEQSASDDRRHFERNISRQAAQHRPASQTTTHHRLHFRPKCHHQQADLVFRPQPGRYTKISNQM